MSKQEKSALLKWCLLMYINSRKPHRLRIKYDIFADDMGKILSLAAKHKMIAERFNSGQYTAMDEINEESVIEYLEVIGKKYGWIYGSMDDGLSSYYVIAGEHVPIPTWE